VLQARLWRDASSGISVDPDIFAEAAFLDHLIHAGVSSFGLVIELIISAIREALLDPSMCGRRKLEYLHFIRVQDYKTDSNEDLNPFLSENWSVIDTRKLMYRGDDIRG